MTMTLLYYISLNNNRDHLVGLLTTVWPTLGGAAWYKDDHYDDDSDVNDANNDKDNGDDDDDVNDDYQDITAKADQRLSFSEAIAATCTIHLDSSYLNTPVKRSQFCLRLI